MNIQLLNAYLLADDIKKLTAWYEKTFDLVRGLEVEEDYNSIELLYDSKFVIALTSAEQMGVMPHKLRQNTVIAQFVVSDVTECLERVRMHGGKVLFGPSFDETGNFHYGGFADIEGNHMWIVQG